MALLLGVDTGGTYTDAVLLRDEVEVIASAKSLTTRHDLSEGIGAAVASVLEIASADPSDIALASLSTTLATNALVEDHGGRVALVYIGFREEDLGRHGLQAALKGDPVLVLQGGHNHAGSEVEILDQSTLLGWLESNTKVSAFAVAAQFATRNPAHELAAAELIRATTGKPVSCSHQLSAKLNGPKRALTALLNARLIGLIDQLVESAQVKLQELKITAPLMMVRGDGALISAERARNRPIETILSGPAASIVGAQWMTGAQKALVSDIGGTTTDIAVLRDGKPAIDPNGARVGSYHTMVEAVAVRTHGLGGDSEVHLTTDALEGGLFLGPKRVVPLSLIATEAVDVVLPALQAQISSPLPGEYDGRFVRRVLHGDVETLAPRDSALLERVGPSVYPLGDVLRSRLDVQSLHRLVSRGLLQVAGLTPTDASHMLGLSDVWNVEAAELGLRLMARKRTRAGTQLAKDAIEMAKMIIDQVTIQTSLALLETVFAEDEEFSQAPEQLARHVLLHSALGQHQGLIALDARVNLPVVGLGASASTYYPAVGERLNCETVLPEHANVANAIGAVVGRITVRLAGTVTSPSEGKFRTHFGSEPLDFGSPKVAMADLEERLRTEALREAKAAGAEDIQISVERDIRRSEVEARDVFIEAELTVAATGRPRIAT